MKVSKLFLIVLCIMLCVSCSNTNSNAANQDEQESSQQNGIKWKKLENQGSAYFEISDNNIYISTAFLLKDNSEAVRHIALVDDGFKFNSESGETFYFSDVPNMELASDNSIRVSFYSDKEMKKQTDVIFIAYLFRIENIGTEEEHYILIPQAGAEATVVAAHDIIDGETTSNEVFANITGISNDSSYFLVFSNDDDDAVVDYVLGYNNSNQQQEVEQEEIIEENYVQDEVNIIEFLNNVLIKTVVMYDDLTISPDEKFTNGDSIYYTELSKTNPTVNEDGTYNINLAIRTNNRNGIFDPLYGLLVKQNDDNTFSNVGKLEFSNKGNMAEGNGYHLLETTVNDLKGQYVIFLFNTDAYSVDRFIEVVANELGF